MRRRPAVLTLTLALVAAPLLPAASPALAASPVAIISMTDTALKRGETSTVTFQFTEPVLDFTPFDITVVGGTITGLVGSGTTYAATFVPADGFQGPGTILVDNAGITDADGTPGTGTSSRTFSVDTLPPGPGATITFSDSALAVGKQPTVTFRFSEPVLGFTSADVFVPNATLGAVSSSDGGITWTATLTPTHATHVMTNALTVDLSGVQDLAGNAGTGTWQSPNYAVDTLRPTGVAVVQDTDLRSGETSLVTFIFSEPVSGLTAADVTVQNGTISAPTSADGGRTWTATLTPAAGTTAPSNVLVLDMTGVADAAGNLGSGVWLSNSYAVRTAAPSATVAVSTTSLRADDVATVTITFSEAVSGFTTADLTAGLGTLSTPTSADGGVTWTSVLTPAAGAESPAEVVTVDVTGVTNADGTSGTGTATSDPYAVDTLRPTATVDVAPPVIGIGGTATVTLTFSEPVSGVGPASASATGGTLTALASADGGVTWTGTFLPAAATETTTGSVAVDLAAVQDLAGNAGADVVTSVPLTVDTVAPTATLRLASARITGPTTLTVEFSEAVPTLTLAHLVATRGTLSALATADGGRTWTATYTPDTGVLAGALTIALDLPGVTDAAGNAGAAAVLSAAFAVDTVAATTPAPAAPVPAASAAAAAPTVAPTASRTTPALARTGSDALALLGAAAALLATGLAAVRLRARRRPTP